MTIFQSRAVWSRIEKMPRVTFPASPFAAEQQFTLGPPVVNSVRFSSGAFEFYFTNQSALNFKVLASTNVALPLGSWTNLGPATALGSDYHHFTAAGAIGQARRFSMLREQ